MSTESSRGFSLTLGLKASLGGQRQGNVSVAEIGSPFQKGEAYVPGKGLGKVRALELMFEKGFLPRRGRRLEEMMRGSQNCT